MTPYTQMLAYETASTAVAICPLCNVRPASPKAIYGHHVCKKCRYKFINRRQGNYIIDAVLIAVLNMTLLVALRNLLISANSSAPSHVAIGLSGALLGGILFCMRDAIGGRSPGKLLCGLRVVDASTGQPISVGKSVARNWMFTLGAVPLVGPLASLVILIVENYKVAGGYRMGDRMAGTRVVWLKHAHLPMFGGDPRACQGCGYDLRGNVSGICPECGKALSAEQMTANDVPPMELVELVNDDEFRPDERLAE
jgi:uncharacterized RDD family membrane protein YckC